MRVGRGWKRIRFAVVVVCLCGATVVAVMRVLRQRMLDHEMEVRGSVGRIALILSNKTPYRGRAREAARKLRNAGFRISSVRDEPIGSVATTCYDVGISPSRDAEEELERVLGCGEPCTTRGRQIRGVWRVLVGTDFNP